MIVGITGKKRAGKDTLAGLIAAELDVPVTTIAFADPLKEALEILNPTIPLNYAIDGMSLRGHTDLQTVIGQVGWEQAKDKYPEVRRLMQTFGSDVIRHLFDQDFWVNELIKNVRDYKMLHGDNAVVIVPDVRFPNEAKVTDLLIRVVRDGTGGDAHASETALDGYPADFTVDNNGTHEDLQKSAVRLARAIEVK